ncbi:MAG: glycosyltransferase family 2 protein [Candidatus Omnitrophica bacterium]|nr:glycosyltransferase family 2 protein [Candidatus Omnitrophota bacterium]
MKDLTILTLFGGRWHTLEPYLHGLLNLDWPVKGLKLLWYTNAEARFAECLNWQAQMLRKKGCKVRLIHDKTLPPAARVFHEGDQRTEEHLNTIAALYNAAWQYAETDDILFLEDDILTPSHALRRLTRVMNENPKAAIVASCVFDRHNEGVVFVWDVVQVYSPGNPKPLHQLVQAGQPWGVRRVSAGGFSCTLIRKSRLPALLEKKRPFKVRHGIDGKEHIGGCDLSLCLEAEEYGGETYADFDVRALHIDSKGRIH